MRYAKLSLYTVLYLFTIGLVISSFMLHAHPLDSPIVRILRTVIVFFASTLLAKYTLSMVLAPWHGIQMRRDKYRRLQAKDLSYHPLVSVMIPAWNEEVGLLSTIKTLLGSTYTHLELVVVNDGSTDGSDALMRAFVARYEREMANIPLSSRIRILYHYQQNGGKGSALNTAISLAHGEILMSIDADCIIDSRAIECFVAAFRDQRVMAAVGNVKIGNTKTLLGVIQYLEYCFGFYGKRSDSVLGTIYIIGGAAGAFRREVFEQLGGYDTRNITEDIELSTRCQKAGMKIVYVPDALIYTEGPSSLQGLMKQRVRWKRGRFQTFWQHRDLFFSFKRKQNKMLSWVILPLALFSEVQLAMEPIFLATLYIFGFLSADFSAFISGIIIVSLMFAIQALDNREQGDNYIWLALIGWLLFYLCSFVECYALFKSIWMMIRKKELKWQKWARKGVV